MPDPPNFNPLESWQWHREAAAPEIFQLCRQIIAGEVRLAEGARAMDDLLSAANPWFSHYGHDDFKALAGLAGATLHLPVGPARRHWAADAIRRKEPELCAIEDQHRVAVLAEAQRVLIRASQR